MAFSYQGSDFVQPISEPPDDLSRMRLSEQELAMYLDLGPYANPSYYVVQVRHSVVMRWCVWGGVMWRSCAEPHNSNEQTFCFTCEVHFSPRI